MNPPGKYPEMPSAPSETRLAWLVALVASGLVLVAGALALDLHNQRRRSEDLNVQLKKTYELREAERKSLAARSAIADSALKRLNDLYSQEESDLKKLRAAYNEREPLVKQSTEVRDKIQALANDLLELAKTDEEARTIVRKYDIKQTSPPTGAGAARP
jgi:hypothetical protein